MLGPLPLLEVQRSVLINTLYLAPSKHGQGLDQDWPVTTSAKLMLGFATVSSFVLSLCDKVPGG